MDSKKQLIIAIVISALLFGGGGYMLGKKSGGSAATGFQRGTFGDRTAGGQGGGNRTFGRGGQGGAGVTMGEVLSKDATSMTVKLRDGGSRIVFYGASTGVMRTATGTSDDISIGTQVFVTGAQNPDGSVTAESIQLRPEGMMMRTNITP